MHLYHPLMPVDVARLALIRYPDPMLRRTAQPVERVDDEVRAVAVRMFELMHEHEGVGLAAPQVGLAWRMFVANPTLERGGDRAFINPVITPLHRDTGPHDEGCLSLPDIRAPITRPVAVRIEAIDERGRPVMLEDAAFAARVWQHETDHLDGVLILDRMAAFDKMANRRAIKALEASG